MLLYVHIRGGYQGGHLDFRTAPERWPGYISGGVYIPLVKFMYLVFTRMPGELP